MDAGTERRRTSDYSIATSLKNIEKSCEDNAKACEANAASLATMNIKLFGEVTGENQQGRLVRLETKSSKDNERITGLEKWRWMAIGAGAVIGFFGHKILALL